MASRRDGLRQAGARAVRHGRGKPGQGKHGQGKHGRARPLRPLAAVMLCAQIGSVAVLVAACGLQRGHRHPAHDTKPPANQASSAEAACAPTDIRVRLDARSIGVAAGTSYVPLDFTNISAAACRLAGFPSVTVAAGQNGKQIGPAATSYAGSPGSGTGGNVVLSADGTAHAWLHIADAANLPASQCRPVRAAGLDVALPGETQATFVRYAVTTCAGRVTGTDILTVEPFHPGPARPGTAQ